MKSNKGLDPQKLLIIKVDMKDPKKLLKTLIATTDLNLQ